MCNCMLVLCLKLLKITGQVCSVQSKQEQTHLIIRRQICCRHKSISPFPQDKPLFKLMLNILFPSCVKIKPWDFSERKPQWSVSPLDALPCVCGVIRYSWWPMKNSRGLSTSTATWDRVCLMCLAPIRPIRAKVWQWGGGLNGSLKKVQMQGNEVTSQSAVSLTHLGWDKRIDVGSEPPAQSSLFCTT